MKQLTCEMCGSTDLIKQDGVFVCQSCGCKYSVEEAKKMMIEGTVDVQGTVKIDSSEELKNLYELARRAKKDRNWDNAAKYYEMITIKDPTNWEPAFYAVFSKATTCSYSDMYLTGNSIFSCLESTLELIKNTISDKSVQIQAYTEVTNQVIEIDKALNDVAKKHFNKYSPEIRDNFKEKFLTNISATICIMYELGDKLDLFFGSDIEANKLSVIAWKQGIEFERSLIPYLVDTEFIKNHINNYEKKISKYDSSFKLTDTKLYTDDENELMIIEDICEITGRGIVVTGTVKNRTIAINETVMVNNKFFKITGIEHSKKLINNASVGMDVGILLRNATKNDFNVGDVIYYNTKLYTDIEKDELIIKFLEGEHLTSDELNAIGEKDEEKNSLLQQTSTSSQKKGGCYVATAVYGSYDCPQVWTLRRYRDYTLAETWYGRLFIMLYYSISPTLVKWFGNTTWFKKMWKGKLDRMVAELQEKGVEATPYEDRIW